MASLVLPLTPAAAFGIVQLDHDADEVLDDFDVRTEAATIGPSAAQLEAAEALDATVRWGELGTARTVIRHGDVLASGIEADDAESAALAWLDDHRVLFRLGSVDGLEVHAAVELTDDAHVVVFQQRIGGLLVSPDGMASIGVVGSADAGWDVVYASSTFVADDEPAVGAFALSERLSTRDAVVEAAAAAGVNVAVADVEANGSRNGWQVLEVDGIDHEQLVRRVAFPMPNGGARPAFEAVYFDGATEGYTTVVDAETGEILLRASIVDHSDDDPTWEVYPATPRMTAMNRPPWNFPSADTRDLWCWTFVPACRLLLENDAARVPWDVDAVTGDPTFTTVGNATFANEWWHTTGPQAGPGQQPVAPDRQYRFPFTNVWYETQCSSDNLVEGGNDIDAAVANLFAGNWRMHTWSYHLGFTEETWNAQAHNFGINPGGEGDAVRARAQAGAITPGSRNNATMATPPDGTSPTMSMFLWQPAANAFYGPCVVGDFDMTVIGHEYGHTIENRLIAKGTTPRLGFHAGAMGESWSDFLAVEYLFQSGFRTSGAHPFAVGAYVTGNTHRGIRNYNMMDPSAGQFPQAGRDVKVGALSFGSMGYDLTGPQVHADSQIWSATNMDIRSLFLDRYPGQGGAVQRECADGLRDADECPGNRRWAQLVFDAMILMPRAPTMLDARDAYFAADQLRFDGANQDLLWLGFSRRGFGADAFASGTGDTNPVPSFASPEHDNATLTFEAVSLEDGQPVDADVFAGHYEARTTPLQDVEEFVPDPRGYDFVARADGYGHVRFHVRNLRPGEERTIRIHFPTNVASQHQGATASGDGVRHDDLIDDTEATNWESPGLPNTVTIDPPSPAAGSYGATGAAFGPEPTEEGVAGDIVLVNDGSANPTLGCDPLVDFPAGSIALIDRGVCPFVLKVNNAQDAGATAVIVANNVPTAPITMGGTDPDIIIPSVMVSLGDGDTIKAGLPATGTVARTPSAPVQGRQVVIELDGEQSFRQAKASAHLLPGQNRFTALRQFELYACTAGNPDNPDCDGGTEAGWDRILRSQRDAFPAPNPRPSAPDLILRTFPIPDTTATHVRFVVLNNQCTGNPNFQGEQHDDPTRPSSDCRTTAVGAEQVRATELQLLTSRPRVDGASRVD